MCIHYRGELPVADQLAIDFGQLGQTAEQLRSITSGLSSTAEMSGGIAHLTGHQLLGDAVLFFAARWNIQRADMIDAVDVLRASMDKIITNFTDTDESLAKQFNAAASADGGGDR